MNHGSEGAAKSKKQKAKSKKQKAKSKKQKAGPSASLGMTHLRAHLRAQ